MVDLAFIFPTPIGIVDNTSNNDYSSLMDLPTKKHPSNTYEQSEDSYILDTHSPELKTWLEEQVNDYAKLALCINQPIKITQSWLIIHRPNEYQFIYAHRHPNSLISGSFYIAGDEQAPLRFDRNEVNTSPYIEWTVDEEQLKNSQWNYLWTTFEAKTNRLIMFPSNLSHGVNGVATDKFRCSLAFNTWFADNIWGNPDNQTEIKLNV